MNSNEIIQVYARGIWIHPNLWRLSGGGVGLSAEILQQEVVKREKATHSISVCKTFHVFWMGEH